MSAAVKVKVEGLDPVDDASLSLSVWPGFVLVFEGKLVDVLICTFSRITGYFTSDAQIAFLLIWILDHHGDPGARFHVFILDAPFIGIDQNIVSIRIEPDWSHLR